MNDSIAMTQLSVYLILVFVLGGHANDVSLYDVRTGKLVSVFANLHKNYINVLKFANHNPFLFATSSFDHSIKLWDIRTKGEVHIQSIIVSYRYIESIHSLFNPC